MTGWFVYILECDKSSLYTGVTTDVDRRYREHLSGGVRSAKYTRSRHRVELAYCVAVEDKSLAMRIEYRLKRLPARRKRHVMVEGLALTGLLDYLGLPDS